MARNAAEDAAEMGLVGEAAIKRNFAQRRVGGEHQLLGMVDAPPADIVVRGSPETRAKGGRKIAGTQARDLGQFIDVDASGKLFVDMPLDPTNLPWSQPATRRGRRIFRQIRAADEGGRFPDEIHRSVLVLLDERHGVGKQAAKLMVLRRERNRVMRRSVKAVVDLKR